MRRSSFMISLLLSLFLLQIAQGIRLEKEYMQLGHQKNQKEKSSLTLTDERRRRSSSDNNVGNVACKEEHCGKGMLNRKLVTSATVDTSNMTTGTSNVVERSTLSSSDHRNDQDQVGHQHHDHQSVDDVMNLTEMDYSPPKRKSPIHN